MKPLSALQMRGDTAGLEKILRAYGAPLYSPQFIHAHKRSELAKAPPPSRLWPYIHDIRLINTWLCIEAGRIAKTLLVLGLTGVFAAYVLFVYSSYGLVGRSRDLLDLSDFALITSLGMLVASFTLMCLNQLAWLWARIRITPPARWVIQTPEQFGVENLPPLAQRIIQGAKMAFPGAPVTVHALKQDREILDPILEIGAFYALVWDKDGATVEPA